MSYLFKCKFLCIASAMMFLFGIVRGIGGFIDILNTTDNLQQFSTDYTLIIVLAVIFILLSAAAFITSIGIFEQNKRYIFAGIIIAFVFVIATVFKGLIFNSNLFSVNNIINTASAFIITVLLIFGNKTLTKTERT